MENISTELNAKVGRLLFKVDYVSDCSSKIFVDYVVAWSQETATSLFRHYRPSCTIRNTRLLACEGGGMFAPTAQGLYLEE